MSCSFSRFCIILVLIGILSSCSFSSPIKKQEASLTTTGATGALVTTGTVRVSPAMRRNNRSIKPVTSSGVSVSVTQEKMLERVKNIATLDDLVAFNSGILNNPKKDHPRFVELQKKQMLLGMMQARIQTPEYQKLQKSVATIYEARELWTTELLSLDTKIQEVMKSFSTNT